eukprot:3413902-Pleurochrysis_carterae.AAC.3
MSTRRVCERVSAIMTPKIIAACSIVSVSVLSRRSETYDIRGDSREKKWSGRDAHVRLVEVQTQTY